MKIQPWYKQYRFSPSEIYFLFHPDGTFVELLSPHINTWTRFGFIKKELEAIGNISILFNTERLKSNPHRANLDQIKNFKDSFFFDQIHSLLPQCSCTAEKVESDLYLGRLHFFEMEPNTLSDQVAGYFFVDAASDRILAFNQGFADLIGKSPQEILGAPPGRFFARTPSELQDDRISASLALLQERFETRLRHDFTREGPSQAEEYSLWNPAWTPGPGLLWNNDGTEHSYISLLSPLDTRTQDFRFRARLSVLAGHAPYFTLGIRYQGGDKLPDQNGYLLGRYGLDPEHRAIIKRNELIAAWSPSAAPAQGPLMLEFAKLGQALFLFQDGKRETAYYDNSFIHKPTGIVSLGLRPGCRVRIESLELWVRRRAADGGGTEPWDTIHLKDAPERHYRLERGFNHLPVYKGFLHGFEALAVYFLSDMTILKERMAELDRKYRIQLRREKELRGIIRGELARDALTSDLTGKSRSVATLRETARTVAASNAMVLIEGETGSGKEVLARFLHRESGRRDEPFVKLDCATIPPPLLESHLFGHEKGAFTGAADRFIGVLEQADRGTLFLDEVGNLTLETQAKLLQFLNDFSITRLGSTERIRLDVRCLFASNEDLEKKVARKAFREDLFFRMNVILLRMPPLRDRKEDIPELAGFFLAHYADLNQKKIRGFTPQALQKLLDHRWSGNVRELGNAIQRAVVFCPGDLVGPELLEFSGRPENGPAALRPRSPFSLKRTEPRFVEELIRRHHGVVKEAAKELGVNRVTLQRYLKSQGWTGRQFRKGFGEGAALTS